MVRLNLAIASRIYLLEPQWNPSIESQAIGRALRLGRTTPVVVFRYIMAGTVEEVSIPKLLLWLNAHLLQSYVLDRQKRKLQLASGGFGKAKTLSSEKNPFLVRNAKNVPPNHILIAIGIT